MEKERPDLSWDDLKTLWSQIQERQTPDWNPGQAFEYLILRAFELDGAEVIWPFSVKMADEVVEQIDGVIHWQGLSCLVECKDWDDRKNVDIGPIAKLRNQLLRRPSGTIGLVFSRTGFTDPALILAGYSLPQAILLWNGTEVEYVLQEESIVPFLRLKYQWCVEQGFPDFNIKRGRPT